tara:strand:+ start:231 stop:1328 length:1098 start_codon:yes stop_codon:yes gene_type:complete
VSLGPLEIYQAGLKEGRFHSDAEQLKVIMILQSLFESVMEKLPNSKNFFLRFLFKKKDIEVPKGLYLWGGVGRGKTLLMDIFFESLPFEEKVRLHFHRFMKEVHARLANLQGSSNPLKLVASQFREKALILCFDEFYVTDIGDAMLLGGLLDEMINLGMILVATSNVPPSHLYENGLQRRKFLPAIELIENSTKVHELANDVDYRLRALENAGVYHHPLNKESNNALETAFEKICMGNHQKSPEIIINGRKIVAKEIGNDIAWFDFSVLCKGARSQNDYIELAKIYQTIILSNVPSLAAEQDDQARRFISLIDEFYDTNVKLIISAEVPIENLYRGQQLTFEFQRTRSRLIEMQSTDYLMKQHLP